MAQSQNKQIVIIGAGINGVSAAIWLRRAGLDVTLVDRHDPGSRDSASYGNAGVLASCSVAPVTAPGMLFKSPKMLLDPNFPLFLRWSYLPTLAPWLLRYMSHANVEDNWRISKGLAAITGDSLAQHQQLVAGTDAQDWVVPTDYSFAYLDRAAFEGDAFTWELREKAGFVPQLLEGEAVREFEPLLSPKFNLLAVMKDHGLVQNPGGYVAALADVALGLGCKFIKAQVNDIEMVDGHASAVLTEAGKIECDKAVLTGGVWSKTLMEKLGVHVPMESERGYHMTFKSPSQALRSPIMVTTGKFVANVMQDGLRCAGVVEFGGLEAEASDKPLKLLEKQMKLAFPEIEYEGTDSWLGHRPAPSDSLPLIGEVQDSGVFVGFGHHHIGLTAGARTGRMIADLITSGKTDIDPSPYEPTRF